MRRFALLRFAGVHGVPLIFKDAMKAGSLVNWLRDRIQYEHAAEQSWLEQQTIYMIPRNKKFAPPPRSIAPVFQFTLYVFLKSCGARLARLESGAAPSSRVQILPASLESVAVLQNSLSIPNYHEIKQITVDY